MRKINPLLIAAGLMAATMVPVAPSGADGGSQPQARARLEERRASIDSQLGEKTGAMQRRQLRRQREQIDAAMQQLQSGRRVAPEEIDRILGETSVERAD
jgi:hypothetical protein